MYSNNFLFDVSPASPSSSVSFHTPSLIPPSFPDQILPMLDLDDDDDKLNACFYLNSESRSLREFNIGDMENDSILAELETKVNMNSWSKNHPSTWTADDVLNFVYFVVNSKSKQDLDSFRGEAFANLDGQTLQRMQVEDFVERSQIPELGVFIYYAFVDLCQNCTYLSPTSILNSPPPSIIPTTVQMLSNELESEMMDCYPDTPIFSELTPQNSSQSNNYHDFQTQQHFPEPYLPQNLGNSWIQSSCYGRKQEQSMQLQTQENEFELNYFESSSQPNYNCINSTKDNYNKCNTQPKVTSIIKQKRGRPKKRNLSDDEELLGPKRALHIPRSKLLWEFVCDLLKDCQAGKIDEDSKVGVKETSRKEEKTSKVVEWQEKELGIFKIVNTKRLTDLWGRHKSNKTMSFEKLSRALRWCKKESKTMAELPETRKFPRRCYRFGPRAFTWRELTR